MEPSLKRGWPGRMTHSWDRDLGGGEDSAVLPRKKTLRWRHRSYLQNLRFQHWWLCVDTWANSPHELVASLQVLNKPLKALSSLNQNHLPQESYI